MVEVIRIIFQKYGNVEYSSNSLFCWIIIFSNFMEVVDFFEYWNFVVVLGDCQFFYIVFIEVGCWLYSGELFDVCRNYNFSNICIVFM